MYHLGKDGWGERVGRIAAAIFAFYPTFIGYTNILLTELSCIFFVSLFCWMMLRCLQKPNFGWAVAAGAALGVCALIRDTLFYAGPIMTVFLGLWGWRARRSFLKPAAIFAGSFILTILPWCVRNTALNGQPTLISSVGGITFYLCNNEKAPLIRSSSLFYEKQIGEEYYYETLLPELNGLSETEKNDIVTRMAFEYMLANPGATIIRMLGRFVDFWGQERLVINHLVSGYYGNLPSTLTMMLMAAVIGGYSLIMAGACIGCFFSRLRAFEIFGFIFIAYYTAMHLLVFAHPRYHLPLLPLIILIAARAYADRAAIIKNWRTRQFAGAAGLFIVFVVMWIIGLFVFDASYLEKFMQRLG
jgi:4-amino-4-deoxy-L-arabinose transferase-like glycosyltransferase